MPGRDVTVSELLDRFVPEQAGRGDWGAVVRDANLARPRRRRWLGAAAAVGIAVVAIALVVLLAPARQGGGSVLDRARAAIGNGPVLHVVMRYALPRYTVIDLATGRQRPVYDEVEEWSDPSRGTHWIDRAEGHVVDDSVWRQPERDPALLAFIGGYERALADGEARVVERGELDGRPVLWLAVGTPGAKGAPPGIEVAVDADSYRPVALRAPSEPGGGLAVSARILDIGTEPEGAGNFESATQPRPFPRRGDVVDSTAITTAEAAGVLETPVLWVGTEVAGLPLSLVRTQELKMVYPPEDDLPPQTVAGLSLVYGATVNDHPDSGGEFVQIQEASSPAFAYGWNPTDPPTEPGTLRVKTFYAAPGSTGGDWYRGEIVLRGTYVIIAGYDLDTVIAAAKGLKPLG